VGLVARREDERANLVAAGFDVRQIRNDEVDAELVGVREHDAGIDEVGVLDDALVAAFLAFRDQGLDEIAAELLDLAFLQQQLPGLASQYLQSLHQQCQAKFGAL